MKGRNLTESEHVKLGAYHTLELEPGRSFMLHKALWDSLDIERIRTATDPQASADLAALLITVRRDTCAVSGAVQLCCAVAQTCTVQSAKLCDCYILSKGGSC